MCRLKKKFIHLDRVLCTYKNTFQYTYIRNERTYGEMSHGRILRENENEPTNITVRYRYEYIFDIVIRL